MRTVKLALLVLASTLLACPSVAELEEDSPVVTYVTYEIREKCTNCHSIGKVLAAHHDRAEWIKIVWIQMRPKAPELFDTFAEAEPMIDFLAERYSY